VVRLGSISSVVGAVETRAEVAADNCNSGGDAGIVCLQPLHAGTDSAGVVVVAMGRCKPRRSNDCTKPAKL
jgi:hypothetical protein